MDGEVWCCYRCRVSISRFICYLYEGPGPAPDPVDPLCLGSLLPSKKRRTPTINNLGGGLGGPKPFMLKFFVCFICALLGRWIVLYLPIRK